MCQHYRTQTIPHCNLQSLPQASGIDSICKCIKMQVEMELWHIKCGELPLTGQDTTVQHSTSQDTTVQHSTLHDIHTVHICTVLISWGPDKIS